MNEEKPNLRLLLVDDEEEFRKSTSATLSRRGFTIVEAADGFAALEAIKKERPDVVLLDLKMPGMDGIETLQKIREIEASLPVIILTGHGDFHTVLASIKLEIVDFIEKPFDINQLAVRIRSLLESSQRGPLRERTIAELIVSPSYYPKLYVDEPVTTALNCFQKVLSDVAPKTEPLKQVRSALVYDRKENFIGLIRFTDLMRLIMPAFLAESPYTTFFTGMFIAQCKVIGRKNLSDLIGDKTTIKVQAPLMEAVHLMVKYHLVNLPVVEEGRLLGILRERDIILEIERFVR